MRRDPSKMGGDLMIVIMRRDPSKMGGDLMIVIMRIYPSKMGGDPQRFMLEGENNNERCNR
jgi:hypothetical protein